MVYYQVNLFNSLLCGSSENSTKKNKKKNTHRIIELWREKKAIIVYECWSLYAFASTISFQYSVHGHRHIYLPVYI